jgi:hypothetical protein
MAIMVIKTCEQVEGGLPFDVKWKMYFNVFLDFIIGFVPILGDIGDAMFHANTRNAIILERYLRANKGRTERTEGGYISTPGLPPLTKTAVAERAVGTSSRNGIRTGTVLTEWTQ